MAAPPLSLSLFLSLSSDSRLFILLAHTHSRQAVEELNIKPKHYRDLLTDLEFSKKDVITLQDPLSLDGKNTGNFDHVKRERLIEPAPVGTTGGSLGNVSEDVKRALKRIDGGEGPGALAAGGGGAAAEAERLLAMAKADDARKQKDDRIAQKITATEKRREYAPMPTSIEPSSNRMTISKKPGTHTWNTDDGAAAAAVRRGDFDGFTVSRATSSAAAGTSGGKDSIFTKTDAMRTTGACSRSFTSSVFNPTTANVRESVVIERNPTKKAFLRMVTSAGHLNIELHSDIVPRTCENFITLARQGYYDGTVFHRCIARFMIQGGDPTGTGRGGESMWGRAFRDELDSRLSHDARGVLAMANSGKNTNGSQFYITFRPCPHLDSKHAVFGRVVGGLRTLDTMEGAGVDAEDRPISDIKILGVEIFTDPYAELAAEEQEERQRQNEQSASAGGRGPDEGGTILPIVPPSRTSASDPQLGGGNGSSSLDVGRYLHQTAPKIVSTSAHEKKRKPGGAVSPAVHPRADPVKKAVRSGGFGDFSGW